MSIETKSASLFQPEEASPMDKFQQVLQSAIKEADSSDRRDNLQQLMKLIEEANTNIQNPVVKVRFNVVDQSVVPNEFTGPVKTHRGLQKTATDVLRTLTRAAAIEYGLRSSKDIYQYGLIINTDFYNVRDACRSRADGAVFDILKMFRLKLKNGQRLQLEQYYTWAIFLSHVDATYTVSANEQSKWFENASAPSSRKHLDLYFAPSEILPTFFMCPWLNYQAMNWVWSYISKADQSRLKTLLWTTFSDSTSVLAIWISYVLDMMVLCGTQDSHSFVSRNLSPDNVHWSLLLPSQRRFHLWISQPYKPESTTPSALHVSSLATLDHRIGDGSDDSSRVGRAVLRDIETPSATHNSGRVQIRDTPLKVSKTLYTPTSGARAKTRSEALKEMQTQMQAYEKSEELKREAEILQENKEEEEAAAAARAAANELKYGSPIAESTDTSSVGSREMGSESNAMAALFADSIRKFHASRADVTPAAEKSVAIAVPSADGATSISAVITPANKSSENLLRSNFGTVTPVTTTSKEVVITPVPAASAESALATKKVYTKELDIVYNLNTLCSFSSIMPAVETAVETRKPGWKVRSKGIRDASEYKQGNAETVLLYFFVSSTRFDSGDLYGQLEYWKPVSLNPVVVVGVHIVGEIDSMTPFLNYNRINILNTTCFNCLMGGELDPKHATQIASLVSKSSSEGTTVHWYFSNPRPSITSAAPVVRASELRGLSSSSNLVPSKAYTKELEIVYNLSEQCKYSEIMPKIEREVEKLKRDEWKVSSKGLTDVASYKRGTAETVFLYFFVSAERFDPSGLLGSLEDWKPGECVAMRPRE